MPKLDDRLELRLAQSEKEAFIRNCEEYDVIWQDMLREMITAFNERRIRILVPKTQLKILRGIHHAND